MPKSSFGSGIGLSSDFRAADAMWLNDRNRKSAQKAAANAIDAKEREKASEYVTKYIDVNNSGINPLWAGKAKEESIKYLNNFYTGMKLDPNYARSAENIKAFQELSTNLDKWKIASENLGKTAQLAYAHPEDVEVDAQVNEAVNSGDYAKWEAIAKSKGIDPDTYSLGFGTLAKPNMAEHNKHVMNGVYGTTRPSMKEVKEGDFIAAYQVDNGNQEAYDANALRLYNSDPLAKHYFEAKGTGFEGYKALLEKPLPQSKFSHISQKQKYFGGNNYNFGGGGAWQNSAYNATPLTFDPTTKRVTEISFAANGANKTLDDYRFEQIDTPILGSDAQPLKGGKTKDGVFVGFVEGTPIGIKNINGIDYVKVKPKDQLSLLKRPNGRFEPPVNGDIIYVPYEKGNINIVEQATRGTKDDKGYVLAGHTLYGVKGGKQTQSKAETEIPATPKTNSWSKYKRK